MVNVFTIRGKVDALEKDNYVEKKDIQMIEDELKAHDVEMNGIDETIRLGFEGGRILDRVISEDGSIVKANVFFMVRVHKTNPIGYFPVEEINKYYLLSPMTVTVPPNRWCYLALRIRIDIPHDRMVCIRGVPDTGDLVLSNKDLEVEDTKPIVLNFQNKSRRVQVINQGGKVAQFTIIVKPYKAK
ncbi:hypothetical protein Lser_V15G13561 [Lactuca serriola]